MGAPVTGTHEDPKSAAAEIDRQIHRLYRLWPSNYVAFDLLHDVDTYSDHYSTDERDTFVERFRTESQAVRRVAYEIYANAVVNKNKAEG